MSTQVQKVAVVTGASQGIGAGIVTAYRKLGYGVVATSRHIAASDDPGVVTIQGDIADRTTAERVIAAGVERFGRIDTLVNNAGIFVAKPFTDYTEDDYAAVLGVNLAGFFRITQLAVERMLEQGGGHVVQITSTLADQASSSVTSVLASLTKGGCSPRPGRWPSSTPAAASAATPWRWASSGHPCTPRRTVRLSRRCIRSAAWAR